MKVKPAGLSYECYQPKGGIYIPVPASEWFDDLMELILHNNFTVGPALSDKKSNDLETLRYLRRHHQELIRIPREVCVKAEEASLLRKRDHSVKADEKLTHWRGRGNEEIIGNAAEFMAREMCLEASPEECGWAPAYNSRFFRLDDNQHFQSKGTRDEAPVNEGGTPCWDLRLGREPGTPGGDSWKAHPELRGRWGIRHPIELKATSWGQTSKWVLRVKENEPGRDTGGYKPQWKWDKNWPKGKPDNGLLFFSTMMVGDYTRHRACKHSAQCRKEKKGTYQNPVDGLLCCTECGHQIPELYPTYMLPFHWVGSPTIDQVRVTEEGHSLAPHAACRILPFHGFTDDLVVKYTQDFFDGRKFIHGPPTEISRADIGPTLEKVDAAMLQRWGSANQ